MSNIQVVDNYLPKDYFEGLQKMFFDLPWMFKNFSVTKGDGYPQFVHHFYEDHIPLSDYWKYVVPLVEQINPNALIRMKANATPREDLIKEKMLHVDQLKENSNLDYRVMILYINSNDGYTFFENGDRIESVANRAIFFPNDIEHAGTNCTNQPIRWVLNVNYL